MILININGNLIENMIIQDDMLLFSDVDENNNTIYKRTPTNEYELDSSTYLQVLCKMQCSKNEFNFTFEDLEVVLEQIEDDKDIVIV